VSDSTFAAGRLILGIFEDTQPAPAPPFEVRYRDVTIWAPGA
jgi:hypothetical protein